MSESEKLVGSETGQAVTAKFFVVSINKLVFMVVLTVGFYYLYWSYRNWAAYRDATGDRVIPILRSIVPVIFIYPLVSRIDQHLRHTGVKHDWSPKKLALGMWLIMAASSGAVLLFPDVVVDLKHAMDLHLYNLVRNLLQFVAMVWVVCKIQQAINVLECDPDGASNSSFTGENVVWMALGTSVWIICIVSFWRLFSLAY